MSKLGTIGFKNAEGHTCEFSIYTLDAGFRPGHGGVYIITARHDDEDSHHGHKVLIIGESDDLWEVITNLPNRTELEAQRANCFCVHATQSESARKRIVEELTEKYLSKE